MREDDNGSCFYCGHPLDWCWYCRACLCGCTCGRQTLVIYRRLKATTVTLVGDYL